MTSSFSPRGRTRIQPPIQGDLQQGTIFTAATARNYPRHAVCGIIITARCDIAHSKAPIINYLPVVELNDWLVADYATLLANEVEIGERNKVSNILQANGYQPSLLEYKPIEEIRDRLFPESSDSSKVRKARKKISESAKNLSRIRPLQAGPCTQANLQAVVAEHQRQAEKLLERCCYQQLNGYYFLPAIEVDTPSEEGFVALLREVQYLPIEIASLVCDGLRQHDPSAQPAKLHSYLDFSHFTMAHPIGRLASPYIEHLMQSFSLLFSRIGLPDLKSDYVARLSKETLTCNS